MDLKEILSKTKAKSDKVSVTRTPPSIATEDRPYSVPDDNENLIQLHNPNKKVDTKPATNRQQSDNNTDNKLATNRKQSDNSDFIKINNWQQSDNKLASQPTTILATNRQQSDNKVATIVPFSALVGLQRAIMFFIYKECKNSRSKVTNSLTLEYIASALKTSSGSIKTTLQRLEDKGCILRVEFKNGRGGWSKYEIPDHLFRELLQIETDNKLITNWQQSDNKVASQPTTELATNVSSSSGSINITKTTTTGEELSTKTQLPEEWGCLDIQPLAEIGFSNTHLWQIAQQNKLSPTMVQDSIYAFAFDLTHNNRAQTIKRGSPLNFFMGILRNGQPYTPPDNYESPEDAALRKYYAHKKAEEAKRQQMEQELLDMAFNDWLTSLSEQTLTDLMPYKTKPKEYMANRTFLKEHFKTTEWPNKRQQILQNS